RRRKGVGKASEGRRKEGLVGLPGGWSNPYRYDGQDLVHQQGEISSEWMSARAYSPTLDRFTSHNPSRSKGDSCSFSALSDSGISGLGGFIEPYLPSKGTALTLRGVSLQASRG